MTNSTPSGSPAEPAQQPRKGRRKAVLIGAVGLSIIGAVTLTACGSSGSNSSAPAPASSTTSGKPPGMRHGEGISGAIATENAGTWTVTKREGGTETVTITPTTVFGNKLKPETQQQFAVGDQVMIEGQISGDTITATHISQARTRTNPSTPATTPVPG
ncbi:MAG: hypothetical protein JWN03_2069 [Nocardia sp.]|uniref:DUF5666 domain-containing protein n=1 Tax=Nocardia sp. TaxID=1821 RepID=UPI00262BB1EC|nr:DUF5666 domain-containing protein [Nocardia sp.]MCU1641794.1 hypothetical protein [Nocardia sp.]